MTWSQCITWEAQIRDRMDHYQTQSYVLRSDIFWMTCCTTSRPWAHLTISSKCTLSGTQNASFLSSVNWQTAITLATPTISRSRSFRSREKNREQMDRLALGTASDAVFLPIVKKCRTYTQNIKNAVHITYSNTMYITYQPDIHYSSKV